MKPDVDRETTVRQLHNDLKTQSDWPNTLNTAKGICGVVIDELDCDTKVNEFKFQWAPLHSFLNK